MSRRRRSSSADIAGSRKVEPRKRKHSPARERRKERRLVEQINLTAHARQVAWAETDQPFLTGRLTVELDGLYGDLRDDRKGNPGAAFKGKTSGVRP